MIVILFFRLIPFEEDAKPAELAKAVSAVRQAEETAVEIFSCPSNSFRQITGSPFAYWITDSIKRIFADKDQFRTDRYVAKQGLATADDFRFIRLWWETQSESVVSGTINTTHQDFVAQTYNGKRWVPFAKGGAYSPYYSDIYLLVDWEANGKRIKDFVDPSSGKLYSRPQNIEWYFRSGLTWPLRTTSGLNVRLMPAGCIFGHKGPAIFADDVDQWLGILQSRIFQTLVSFQLAAAAAAARSYEVGVIQYTPVPALTGAYGDQLRMLVQQAVQLTRELDTVQQTSHAFQLPVLLRFRGETLIQGFDKWTSFVLDTRRKLNDVQAQINDIALHVYRLNNDEQYQIEAGIEPAAVSHADTKVTTNDASDDPEVAEDLPLLRRLAADLIEWCVGSAFGRWDVRLATNTGNMPSLHEPFAPLPVSASGALVDKLGFPALTPPDNYPLYFASDGILVENIALDNNIVHSIRIVLGFVFVMDTDVIEKEICQLLSVNELGDYLIKPGGGGFWQDHIRSHSKSRRKAPIYWLLQSQRKNYSIWIYYPRLTSDTLYKALVNYVEPKFREETRRYDELREQYESSDKLGREARQHERGLDQQEILVSDLQDFIDRLQRVARMGLSFDLNDGVVLNMAPLWELVPWGEAKRYWLELKAGKYEWSAMSQQLRQKGIVE